MPRAIAETSNIVRLHFAYAALQHRDTNEGMGLIFGAPGYGKTTGACELFIKHRGLLLTAKPGWTQKALLKALLIELGSEVKGSSNADMLDEAIQLIAEANRPVFVDEADFLFNDSRMLETLRLLHDVSGCPVILVGMSSQTGKPGIERRIKKFPQFSDRITQWVEFFPADFADAQLIADCVCTLSLPDDLLKELVAETKGNVRQLRVTFAKLERYSQETGIKQVNLESWRKVKADTEERNKKMRAV